MTVMDMLIDCFYNLKTARIKLSRGLLFYLFLKLIQIAFIFSYNILIHLAIS